MHKSLARRIKKNIFVALTNHIAMKKIYLFTAAFTFCMQAVLAQTCTDVLLKKGTVLTYESESAPQQIKDLAYIKSNKKEQEKADAEFALKVANGELKGNVSTFTTSVDDVTEQDGSRLYLLNTVKWGQSTIMKIWCSNNIITIAPAKDSTQVKATTAQGNVITTTLNGYNKIPLTLKQGDTIPGYQNVSYISPLEFPIPIYIVRTEKDLSGDTWLIQEKKMSNFVASSTSVSKYSNRQVVGSEDLVIDGVSYKAFLIHNELYSKSSLNTSSKSMMTELYAKAQRSRIEKKIQKAAGNPPDGFLAAVTYEWFVPALGLIAKTEVYDATGRLLATQRLKSIKAS